MDLGTKLKEARVQAGRSQEGLARKIGVSRQTISNWENNRSYPDIGSLMKLSQLYGLSLDALLQEQQPLPDQVQRQSSQRQTQCQVALEVGVLLELLVIALIGRFPVFGLVLDGIATVLVYIAIIGHLRYFDHSRRELRFGIAGLVIQLVNMIALLIWPELGGSLLYRAAVFWGAILLWNSGVWGMFWKSPRMWVYLTLFAAVPLVLLLSGLQDNGAMNPVNPFSHSYCVAQVLGGEDTESAAGITVHLSSVGGQNCRMRLSEYDDDQERYGYFSYCEPLPGQTSQGIWQLIPEDAPQTLYEVAVEEDSTVTLSSWEDGVLQYKWLLQQVDTCTGGVVTFGKTISLHPTWYPEGSTDPKPYLKAADVIGSATLNLGIAGMDSESLTVIEEYHHGNSMEIIPHTLAPNENGSYSLKLETRHDGVEEYSLFRIPYLHGEYRFTLTYG